MTNIFRPCDSPKLALFITLIGNFPRFLVHELWVWFFQFKMPIHNDWKSKDSQIRSDRICFASPMRWSVIDHKRDWQDVSSLANCVEIRQISWEIRCFQWSSTCSEIYQSVVSNSPNTVEIGPTAIGLNDCAPLTNFGASKVSFAE